MGDVELIGVNGEGLTGTSANIEATEVKIYVYLPGVSCEML